jgi:hypothetical protein
MFIPDVKIHGKIEGEKYTLGFFTIVVNPA